MCTTACDPMPVYCRISCKIHTPQREGDGNFEWGSYNIPNVTFFFFFFFLSRTSSALFRWSSTQVLAGSLGH